MKSCSILCVVGHSGLLRALLQVHSFKLEKKRGNMGFAPSNLASKKFILKFVELVCYKISKSKVQGKIYDKTFHKQVMVFIVMMIFRVGGSGSIQMFSWGDNVDSQIFGIMTSVGYFYIIIILLIGIAMGDNNKFTVKFHFNKS